VRCPCWNRITGKRGTGARHQRHLSNAHDGESSTTKRLPGENVPYRWREELDTEDVILHALTTVGASLVAKGEAERGLAMLAESLERAEAMGLPHDAGRAYAGWGDSLLSLERYEEARVLYERMLAYAQKVQAGMYEGVALVQLEYLDWWAGPLGAGVLTAAEDHRLDGSQPGIIHGEGLGKQPPWVDV
jgi:tetratricopeptide (TPR) repeat protein